MDDERRKKKGATSVQIKAEVFNGHTTKTLLGNTGVWWDAVGKGRGEHVDRGDVLTSDY